MYQQTAIKNPTSPVEQKTESKTSDKNCSTCRWWKGDYYLVTGEDSKKIDRGHCLYNPPGPNGFGISSATDFCHLWERASA